jgi:hypothetical protein
VSEELVKIKPLVDVKVLKETLSRMGIPNKKLKILYPSCYVYQNFEDYYICHFKSLFTLTRQIGYKNLSEEDIERRNSIVFCLKNWGLVEIENDTDINPHEKFVYVLPYKEKMSWQIKHKFNTTGHEVIE